MGLQEIADYENLRTAGLKCCKAGRWKASIQNFEMNLPRATARARKKLLSHKFHPTKTNDFWITERGKRRLIRAHTVYDRQIYKSFCDQELKKALSNYILDHNNASQVNKGTDRSIKQFRQGLAKAYKKFGRDFYVITYDYHDYFGTLDHNYIRQMPVSQDTKWLLESYVDVFEEQDNKYYGIGIGGEPSQDISVAYGSKVQRMIACDPTVISSGWYMDDGYAIVHTKFEAQNLLTKVIIFSTKIGLQINFKRTKINWMETDTVLWLKKRTHLTETGKIIMKLTNNNIRDEIKRINEYHYRITNLQMPSDPADISISCWCAYSKPYNSNAQRLKVVNYFGKKFNVPWDQLKILLRRKQTGWLTVRRRSKCQ